MLDPGTYKARASQWELGETSTGKEQLAIELRPMVGELQLEGITWYGYFSEAALPITVRALRALGWTGDDLNSLEGLDRNEVEIVVTHETYEGKTRAKVNFINSPGAGGLALKAPLDDARKRAFAAKMRGAISALSKKQGTAAQASAANGNKPPF